MRRPSKLPSLTAVMPVSILWKCAALGALLFSPAASAANGAVDAMELSRNWQGLVGQTIDISGCTLTSATADEMTCLVKSKQAPPPSFPLDPSGMAAEDVARALSDCSFYVGYPICRVQLQGKVASENGELKIVLGTASWIYPPHTP